MSMRGEDLQMPVGGVYPEPIATMISPGYETTIRRPHVADAGSPRSERTQSEIKPRRGSLVSMYVLDHDGHHRP